MSRPPYFSVIVPVYNRPQEVKDLLDSLLLQENKDFEVIIVEDGSSIPCRAQTEDAKAKGLDVKYFFKENEGRSIARNYGIKEASGRYFIFFDSDCVIPSDYFKNVAEALSDNYTDFFGGPDAAHESFTDTQKAINYSMTSFLTTGGIRGGKIQMEKFTPRTFNMGFSRTVYDRVGGFREMFSEDIDMSSRIRRAGFRASLFRQAPVWHKRRINWMKFWRQVYVFGMSRITLKLLYPGSLKLVHTLPALFVIGTVLCILLGIFLNPWWLAVPIVYFIAVFIGALISTRNLKISLMAVPAAAIQLTGYGCGFIKAWFTKIVLRRARNIDEEIAIRKGK